LLYVLLRSFSDFEVIRHDTEDKTAGQTLAVRTGRRGVENKEMAMAFRGPFFTLRPASPKWSRRTTQVDQSPARRVGARALVLCNLHKIRTPGGAP
jgi:hypothetical protein